MSSVISINSYTSVGVIINGTHKAQVYLGDFSNGISICKVDI